MRGISIVAMTAATLALMSSTSQAQAVRTWVSGVGDDANPCSRTAPCKTFAGAISKTAANGEIDALDPGGFGTVTITKSITLDGTGTLASILASNTNGININGAGIVVYLRNLSINASAGTLTPGHIGINVINASKVFIDNTNVQQFDTAGLKVNVPTGARVFISDSTFEGNATGVQVIAPTASSLVLLRDSDVLSGTTGVQADGAEANVTLDNAYIALHANDLQTLNGGIIRSYGNSVIRGSNPTSALPLK